MASVTVIVNRNARGLRVAKKLMRALASTSCRIVETQTLRDLERTATELAIDRPDVVVLAGGDGTVMEGLSALARAYERVERPLPRIGIVPAGTFSTIANNLSLPRDSMSYARSLVTAAVAGRAKLRSHPTLRVTDATGSRRIGFIFGTGLVAEFFELYDAVPEPDALHAVALVGRLFVGSFTSSTLAKRVLTPVAMRLEVDDQRLAHESYSLVVSSVLRDVGLHLRPTRRAGEDRERVHVVASTRHAMQLAFQLPFVLAARPMIGEGHVDELAKRFRVTFDGRLRSYVLDGDRIVAGREGGDAWVEVERGPEMELVDV